MAKYTQKQTLSFRKVAQLSLIPLAVNFFSGKPISHSKFLPLGQPEVLTEYTVDILSQLLPKAVWSTLAYQFGWTSENYLLGTKTYTGKLWDSCKDHDSVLTFSDYSIELLICLFNDTSSNSKITNRYLNTQAPCCHNGDLILEFCIYITQLERQSLDDVQLNKRQPAQTLSTKEASSLENSASKNSEPENSSKTKSDKSRAKQNRFSNNFLCQLTTPHLNSSLDQETPPLYGIASLESIKFMLPWLSKFWSNHWIKSEKKRWRNKGAFIDYSQKQNARLHSWFHFLIDNKLYQHLNVFMRFYLGWRHSALFDIKKHIDNIGTGTRLRERQDLISRLQLHFDLISALETLYREFILIHPVDRESEIIRFLTDYGKLDFATVITDWRALRHNLVTTVQ